MPCQLSQCQVLYPQTQSEYFTISNCVFNFNFFSSSTFRDIRGSQNYIRGHCAPWMPPSGIFFIPKTSTLAYLIAFLISTFQLQQFLRYQGVPNLHQGGLRTLDAPQRRNFCTLSEHFTISNCVFNFSFLSLVLYEYSGISNSVFNFNFLALVVSEILGGFQIYTNGAYAALSPPCGEIFGR